MPNARRRRFIGCPLFIFWALRPFQFTPLKPPASSEHKLFTQPGSPSTDSIVTILSGDTSKRRKFGVASFPYHHSLLQLSRQQHVTWSLKWLHHGTSKLVSHVSRHIWPGILLANDSRYPPDLRSGASHWRVAIAGDMEDVGHLMRRIKRTRLSSIEELKKKNSRYRWSSWYTSAAPPLNP